MTEQPEKNPVRFFWVGERTEIVAAASLEEAFDFARMFAGDPRAVTEGEEVPDTTVVLDEDLKTPIGTVAEAWAELSANGATTPCQITTQYV